ncbi:T-cell immunomodulatory protein [Pseudolycoriella hygida]|uniref:T-cell immunomodulatory protein n=1 Tax=Pseudolycoriella hygida TaxID=35572 RepID=A0A9Q0S6V7_9DIPT|nr:T-cell immunomodulatory protein [Pseudolycoriella hygida]
MKLLSFLTSITVLLRINVQTSDITSQVFGSSSDGIVGAFGDFNSDELTDVFVIKDNGHVLEVLLGSDVEPLLHKNNLRCQFDDLQITSVVPGDFDGDAFMDLLITTKTKDSDVLGIYINWGGSVYLNCTSEKNPIIRMIGEPVALDYNKDMIIDLFGLSEDKSRTFWVFNDERKPPNINVMEPVGEKSLLSVPHSHAYLDLNGDFMADLFIATEDHFEVWHGKGKEGFTFDHKINLPDGKYNNRIGQSLFLDIELKGQITQLLPICFDTKCMNSSILVYTGTSFADLNVNFKDNDNQQWGFVVPDPTIPYLSTITLRGGDFNMDGFPDLIVTLAKQNGQPQTFLLENVPCKGSCPPPFVRTFEVRWKALMPFSNGTITGAFYDFYQDGILDVLFVEKSGERYRQVAFRNTLDYDANFVKVIVLTGLTNWRDPDRKTPLGRKKRTYGTNLPGPRIAYSTTTQEGDIQHGTSVQIPQSAYFSLQLPYTIFGLGRTPNFVDSLTVGLANRSRTWTQLIPNSQMIVVPSPPEEPQKWKVQLFVTPSKLIVMSVITLGVTCVIIMLIILGLYIKEKREDKIERLQEAHRFHFDAM